MRAVSQNSWCSFEEHACMPSQAILATLQPTIEAAAGAGAGEDGDEEDDADRNASMLHKHGLFLPARAIQHQEQLRRLREENEKQQRLDKARRDRVQRKTRALQRLVALGLFKRLATGGDGDHDEDDDDNGQAAEGGVGGDVDDVDGSVVVEAATEANDDVAARRALANIVSQDELAQLLKDSGLLDAEVERRRKIEEERLERKRKEEAAALAALQAPQGELGRCPYLPG